MYTVYADDTMIHDGASPDIIIHLVEPKLTIGDSVAGSFDFTVNKANPGYSLIRRFTTLITVKRDGKTLWVGRPIKESINFWNQYTFNCEGALAFLNDTNQGQHAYTSINLTSYIATLLDAHNAKVSPSHQFHLGMITVEDMDDDHLYQTDYKSTWEEFKTNCLDRLMGHVRLRYEDNDPIPYFDYLKDYPNTAAQEINFGHNLLDFTRDWDLTDLCTVLIPRGKQLDEEDENGQRKYITVESVNAGSPYVFNQDAYNTFGRIEQTVDFSEVEDPSVLLQLAQTYVSVQQFDQMSMTVNAVDLHRLSQQDVPVYVTDQNGSDFTDSNDQNINAYLVGIHDRVTEENPMAFNLLDEVRCISAPHGLDRMFPITEIQIPLDKPEGVTYTMGTEGGTTMSGVADKTSMILDRIKNLPSTRNILGLAKQQAAQILNQRTTGFVTITEVGEHSQAIIISNTADWENSTKRWMWNINGLGYTKDGGQTYDIAMTMDGTIVADFIKTGILEDGYGLNYWNLSTGEFSLSYNTEFQDTLGNVMTIVDVNTLAQQAEDNALAAGEAANTVNTKVETEKKKQAGSTNLINGTNVLAIGDISDNNWALGEWAPTSRLSGRGDTYIVDVRDAPNKKIVVGVRFKSYQTIESDNGYRSIMQGGVPLGQEQVYCISCYAKGTGKLRLMVGKLVNQSDIGGTGVTGTPMYATATKSVTNDWRRYHLVFATGRNDTYQESNYVAGIINGRVDVHFGLVSEQGSDIQVCGMKLERGNDPTDWGESDFDTQVLANGYTDKTAQKVIEASYEYADAQSEALQTFTRDYVEAISEHDREFTKAQREALDESFNQYKILQRLTENFTRKGIYLQNNELYMNASYIRTGTLDAGIVKTGILTDHAGKNKWNMATGYLYTRNMEAVNAKLDGSFTCGGTYKIQVANGCIYGYKNNSYVGSINYTADMYDIDRQSSYEGLMLRAKGGMQIRMPYISVRRKNDDGIATTCYTGTKRYNVIERIDETGNGGIRWSGREHGIEVLNGLVTMVW